MLMSVIEGALSVPAYPELVGKRVLVAGVTRRSGIDIARAFAERRARVVLQFAEASAAMTHPSPGASNARGKRASRPERISS